MKILGVILFVGVTSWIGFDMSSQLTKRTKQIRQLIQSLQILEAEMGYSNLTLQQVFTSIGKKTPDPIATFYNQLGVKLTEIVPDFVQIWTKELQHLHSMTALKRTEIEILEQFGHTLGQYTFVEQQKHIYLAINQLQSIQKEAIENQLKYGKVMKSLGVLIGIFIALLLI